MITLSQHKDLTHTSRDLSVAQRLMSLICGNHELGTSNRNQLEFEYSGIRLPTKKITIGCISYGTSVSINIDSLGSYSISLPLQGQQQLQSGGAYFKSDHNQGLIVSNIEQQELIIEKDCKKLQVVIPEYSVQSVLSQLLGKPIDETVIFDPEMPLQKTQFLQIWWQNIHQCLVAREQFVAFNSLNLISEDYENFLIKTLLFTQQNNYSDQLHDLNLHKVPKSVSMVKEFIHRFADKDIQASDLIMVSGTSKSTLYREFQLVMHISPMDYLRNFRLEQVHQALQRQQGNFSISRLAMDWGFKHLGRFSQEYREKYGYLPSEITKHPLV